MQNILIVAKEQMASPCPYPEQELWANMKMKAVSVMSSNRLITRVNQKGAFFLSDLEIECFEI